MFQMIVTDTDCTKDWYNTSGVIQALLDHVFDNLANTSGVGVGVAGIDGKLSAIQTYHNNQDPVRFEELPDEAITFLAFIFMELNDLNAMDADSVKRPGQVTPETSPSK